MNTYHMQIQITECKSVRDILLMCDWWNSPTSFFIRWWFSSILRIKTCSRSSMPRCWPKDWCTRTAPATTPRPAWSPNLRSVHLFSEDGSLHCSYFNSNRCLRVFFSSFHPQQACGFEYTSKLQRMFQDIGVSKDLNEQFKKHLSNSEPLDCKCSVLWFCIYNITCTQSLRWIKSGSICLAVDFSIQVLSSGSWPFQQSCTFALPSEVRCLDA